MGKDRSARWRSAEGLKQLRAWRGEGLPLREIAERMGIGIATLKRWQRRYPEIREAMHRGSAQGQETADSPVAKAALTVGTDSGNEQADSPAPEDATAMAAGAGEEAPAEDAPTAERHEQRKTTIAIETLPAAADARTLARGAGLLPLAASADPLQLESLVESALLRRALGYRYATVTSELRKDPVTGEMVMTVTKRIDKEVPPDTSAQLFWLKSRNPEKWRDKPGDEPAGEGEVLVTFDVDEEDGEDDNDWDGEE